MGEVCVFECSCFQYFVILSVIGLFQLLQTTQNARTCGRNLQRTLWVNYADGLETAPVTDATDRCYNRPGACTIDCVTERPTVTASVEVGVTAVDAVWMAMQTAVPGVRRANAAIATSNRPATSPSSSTTRPDPLLLLILRT